MARPFRFGVQTMGLDVPDDVRNAAREIESLGYSEMWSSDHIGTPDPFLPLMVAAEATTMLRFGPLVINNEFHNPVLLARTAATFDVLSGGRLVLGMGTGYMRSEHDASGIPLRDPAPRVTRFDESLRVLRSLLDHGAAQVDGDEVSVALDDLGVRPRQSRVPILVGGHGRRVVRLAGEIADVFQYTGLTHDPATGTPAPGGFALDTVRRRRAWLAESPRADTIESSVLVQLTHVGGDADAQIAAAAERTGLDTETVRDSPFLLIGSFEQVVDKIGRLRDELGISHFVVRDAAGFAPVVDALAGT